MADLPTGTVTFLFTDIEGSTQLWEPHAELMRRALPAGAQRLNTLCEGRVEQGEGGSSRSHPPLQVFGQGTIWKRQSLQVF